MWIKLSIWENTNKLKAGDKHNEMMAKEESVVVEMERK